MRVKVPVPFGGHLFVLALFLTLAGCAHKQELSLSPASAEKELPGLREAVEANPHDARAHSYLGLVLYSLGSRDEALWHLQTAFDIDPGVTEAALILAKVHEKEEHFAAAQAVLLRASPEDRSEKQRLRAALEKVKRRRNLARAKDLLASEQELDLRNIGEHTMAVFEFEAAPEAREMKMMGKALAAVLVADLSRLPDLRLVERNELQALVNEMGRTAGSTPSSRTAGEGRARRAIELAPVDQLAGVQQRLAHLRSQDGTPYYAGEADGEFDEATRAAVRAFQRHAGLTADGIPGPSTQRAIAEATKALHARAGSPGAMLPTSGSLVIRAGRLIGARRIMTGSYGIPAEGYLSVRAQVLDSVDGKVLADWVARRKLDEFHRVSRELVVKTADALGIDLTADEQRESLSLPPPTKSLAAFLAFGWGLDLEDQGLLEDASAAYAKAVRLDSRFDLARERAEITRLR